MTLDNRVCPMTHRQLHLRDHALQRPALGGCYFGALNGSLYAVTATVLDNWRKNYCEITRAQLAAALKKAAGLIPVITEASLGNGQQLDYAKLVLVRAERNPDKRPPTELKKGEAPDPGLLFTPVQN